MVYSWLSMNSNYKPFTILPGAGDFSVINIILHILIGFIIIIILILLSYIKHLLVIVNISEYLLEQVD